MKTLAAMVLVLLAPASAAFAQDDDDQNEYRPHFSWDFRYPGVMSRERLSDESLMITEGIARVTQLGLRQIGTEEEKAGTRQRITMLALMAMIPLSSIADAAEHEMGHLQTISRAGIGPTNYVFSTLHGGERSVKNYCEMFGNIMRYDNMGFGGAGSAVGFNAAGNAAFNARPDLMAHVMEFNIMFSASGLNQEQYTSERIADRVLEGKAVVLDFPMWVCSITSVMRYPYRPDDPGNDIHNYTTDLRKMGVDTNEGHVRNPQWLRLISGSSIAEVYGLWRFLKHCDTQTNPLPIPFPEFASYLSEAGPTFKIRLPFRMAMFWEIPVILEPSYQAAFDRSGYDELGLRTRWDATEHLTLSAGAFTNTSGGSWFEAGAQIRPWKWFEVAFGFDHGSGYTFERDIRGMTLPFLVSKEWSLKLGLGLVLKF